MIQKDKQVLRQLRMAEQGCDIDLVRKPQPVLLATAYRLSDPLEEKLNTVAWFCLVSSVL